MSDINHNFTNRGSYCKLCRHSKVHTGGLYLIQRALHSRYESISNLVFINRIDRVEGPALEDDLLLKQPQQNLVKYFHRTVRTGKLRHHISYLKFHVEFPREALNGPTRQLMTNYNFRKRMLTFVHLSKMLKVPADKSCVSLSSIMRSVYKHSSPLDTQTVRRFTIRTVGCVSPSKKLDSKSTKEQIFKKTLKKPMSKSMNKKSSRSLPKPKLKK